MNEQEIKKLIMDNLQIGIYQNTNYREDELNIKVILSWGKDDIAESTTSLRLNSNNSLFYKY